MSINRLRQLGAGSKPQPNPVDEEWGAGWGDSDEELDFGKDWNKGKSNEPSDRGFKGAGGDDSDDLDDFDDFGAKEANIKNLDDDTPPEVDRNIGGDEEDDSDMDGLGFDLQNAITEGKRVAAIDQSAENANKKRREAEAELARKKLEEEQAAKRIEARAREEDILRKQREQAELEDIKNSIRDRVEVSLSRNKGSTIEKGSRDDSKGGVSDDFQAFLGELDDKKGIPKDSFQLDKSSNRNALPDENKSFEEFDVADKFADLDQDEP